ncbi:hypothetical protein ASD04_06895 [Devosia sp. Root436]|uniref:class I SAM-dependent methyltransferase n=1 Tax=Devosia sp. Root436 TaxID=1736537 RepID=UPI0006F351F8|nr:class I SAM-dependent methyltransferase [Devosia sp. Root436]KQX40350.1 hypothetical protein ASD04_06895 [Devosia sp. Root436]
MFRKFVRAVLVHPVYVRVVKALIRSSVIHEKSEKYRRDVVNAIEAYKFEQEELAGATAFQTYAELVDASVSRADPTLPTWVELGVMTGTSTRHLAASAKAFGRTVTIHGFDSFEGLPEDWHARAKKGAFAIKAPVFSEPNIVIHNGWFDQTLAPFAATNPGQIGLFHVDSDLYSSAKTGFETLAEFIRPGTVILFDEYWNYPEYRDHEYKAFKEFLASSGLGFEYVGYYRDHMQLAVLITKGD